jgi:hypothetical protein
MKHTVLKKGRIYCMNEQNKCSNGLREKQSVELVGMRGIKNGKESRNGA